MARTRGKKGTDFEASLKKLEEIVRRLEDEQVPLEESLDLFAEGKRLARLCETGLADAENRVRQIMEDAGGNLHETPLDAPADGDAAEDDEDSDEDEGGGAADSGKSARPAPKPARKDDLPF